MDDGETCSPHFGLSPATVAQIEYEFAATDEVIEEVTVPEQFDALIGAIEAGHLFRIPFLLFQSISSR